ncbi:BlaI/MecI/CopY family transcriptional regulator [Chryseobacterium sp. A321]
MKLSPLTTAEEQLMHVIWPLESPYLRDIMEALPEPKSHQNTVSTYLKILIEKDYLRTEKEGRIFRYIARVDKETYLKEKLKNLAKEFFDGSLEALREYMNPSSSSLGRTTVSGTREPAKEAAPTESTLVETPVTPKASVKKSPRKKYEEQIAAFVSGLEKVNKKKGKKSKSKKSDSKPSKKKGKKEKKEKGSKGK